MHAPKVALKETCTFVGDVGKVHYEAAFKLSYVAHNCDPLCKI